MNLAKRLYTISDKETEAQVSVTGGTVRRFTVGGENIFYPWRRIGEKERGGCPMCAPWFGSSKYGVKKHGFLRDMRTHNRSYRESVIKLDFFRNKTPEYPWDMRFVTRAVIERERSLKMSLTIVSWGEHAPVLPGFHPYFACDDASKVEILVGENRFQGFSEKARSIPLEDSKITIIIPGKRKIEMELGRHFFIRGKSQMVLWSDSPGKYFCVEPILYDKELFDTPDGLRLDTGEYITIEMALRIC